MVNRNRVSAKCFARPRLGKASDSISLFGTVPVTGVVLWCRVSKPSQSADNNLEDQEANLRNVAARCRVPVLDVVKVVANGNDPLQLATAAETARQLGAALLAETTDRYIRGLNFTPTVATANREQPLISDFWYLRALTDGVLLMTAIDPDAPPAVVMGYHRKRGQVQKGAKGGRPLAQLPGHKRARRDTLAPIARQMHEAGMSNRRIAKELGEPESTIRRWLQNMG